MKDRVVLAADIDIELTLRGMLQRHAALGIRPVTCDIFRHPRRDPGCVREAAAFLRPSLGSYAHALVVFDHHGSGREPTPPGMLADELKVNLASTGWGARAEVIVIAPELEVWVWSRSPHVAQCMGWDGNLDELRRWLGSEGYWPEGAPKPPQPKEAMEAALRHVKQPRSSAIYRDMALRVSLQRHDEPAFLRLTDALVRWFAT